LPLLRQIWRHLTKCNYCWRKENNWLFRAETTDASDKKKADIIGVWKIIDISQRNNFFCHQKKISAMNHKGRHAYAMKLRVFCDQMVRNLRACYCWSQMSHHTWRKQQNDFLWATLHWWIYVTYVAYALCRVCSLYTQDKSVTRARSEIF
jgi:hypothetical protein